MGYDSGGEAAEHCAAPAGRPGQPAALNPAGRGRGRRRRGGRRSGGVRRGRGGKVQAKALQDDRTEFKVLHSNCHGFISKQPSIDDIILNKSPDVYLFNETALKGRRKISIKNYFSFGKNREKHMGGVATVVANHLRQHAVKVAEGREGDEYLITSYPSYKCY